MSFVVARRRAGPGTVQRSLPLLLLALLALAWPALARADASDPPEYRQVVEEAVNEFEAGRFQESRALFTRAHQLFANARTLRGLGMTEFELRNYAESIHNLEEALASKVRTLEGTLRDETERLLKRARAFVSRVTLELKPSQARVIVDGIVVPVGPGQALLLTVGEHVLEIQADGYTSERRVLSVKSGGDEMQRFELRALAGNSPSPAPVQPAPQPPTTALASSLRGPVALPPPAWQSGGRAQPQTLQQSPARPQQATSPMPPSQPADKRPPAHGSKTGAWALTGISGVLLVGGVVMLGLGFKDISDVEGASDGSRWSKVEAANDRAPILTGTGFALSAVGVVGLIGGLVWGLRNPKADKAPSATTQRLRQLAGGRF